MSRLRISVYKEAGADDNKNPESLNQSINQCSSHAPVKSAWVAKSECISSLLFLMDREACPMVSHISSQFLLSGCLRWSSTKGPSVFKWGYHLQFSLRSSAWSAGLARTQGWMVQGCLCEGLSKRTGVSVKGTGVMNTFCNWGGSGRDLKNNCSNLVWQACHSSHVQVYSRMKEHSPSPWYDITQQWQQWNTGQNVLLN